MVVAIQGIMETIQGHLTSSGYTGVVTIGQPQTPPETWQADIELSEEEDEGSTLDKSIERRTITITVYCPTQAETPERIEFFMGEVMPQLRSNLLGDFTLGGVVRNIEGLTTRYSRETIFGGALYRVARMTVPFIVDDSATYAP